MEELFLIMPTKDINKYRGCLFGLSIGDALGAPVEFTSLEQIKLRYGQKGITDFQPWRNFPAGTYTDDTQMALATALGCLAVSEINKHYKTCQAVSIIYGSYLNWLESQRDPQQRRAPGTSCLNALQSGKMGTVKDKINNSKGCGGVMRTAPVGLAFPPGQAFQSGVEYAAITHGHPSGYLPAGVIAEIIAWLVENRSLDEAIEKSIRVLIKSPGHRETLHKIRVACELAKSRRLPEKSIPKIGEGRVGEEALAIALYCSLKFNNNWSGGVLTSVNHSGDSDSTGSITGAILGTLLGVGKIPKCWISRVEDSEGIKNMADEMFRRFGDNKPDTLIAEKLKPICPKCKSKQVIPIVYGYPDELIVNERIQQVKSGKIEMGGCGRTKNAPKWKCKNCGFRWR